MFVTEDGYRLWRVVRADGRVVWADDDMEFDSRGGWPVDVTGERLSGTIVGGS